MQRPPTLLPRMHTQKTPVWIKKHSGFFWGGIPLFFLLTKLPPGSLFNLVLLSVPHTLLKHSVFLFLLHPLPLYPIYFSLSSIPLVSLSFFSPSRPCFKDPSVSVQSAAWQIRHTQKGRMIIMFSQSRDPLAMSECSSAGKMWRLVCYGASPCDSIPLHTVCVVICLCGCTVCEEQSNNVVTDINWLKV